MQVSFLEPKNILASNAIFRKIAYFGRNPFPDFLPKCLLVTYPQTPEIIAVGNGCAFRWNAENQKQEKTYCRDFCVSRSGSRPVEMSSKCSTFARTL